MLACVLLKWLMNILFNMLLNMVYTLKKTINHISLFKKTQNFQLLEHVLLNHREFFFGFFLCKFETIWENWWKWQISRWYFLIELTENIETYLSFVPSFSQTYKRINGLNTFDVKNCDIKNKVLFICLY